MERENIEYNKTVMHANSIIEICKRKRYLQYNEFQFDVNLEPMYFHCLIGEIMKYDGSTDFVFDVLWLPPDKDYSYMRTTVTITWKDRKSYESNVIELINEL